MFKKTLIATTAMTMLTLGAAQAADSTTKAPLSEVNPMSSQYKNNSPIIVTGTIVKIKDDAFELRYAPDASIIVEMDDWDSYDETSAFKEGEKVAVFGNIDQDLFESRKIEANSVYVYSRNMYYFANDADEEDYRATRYFTSGKVNLKDIPDKAWVNLDGMVKEIDGREFTLSLGTQTIIIDTNKMSYNPLDDEGYQKIVVGDVVHVSGDMDKGFFEGKEIKADQIVTLRKAHTKHAS